MTFDDYEERADFSPQELEHILQLPVFEIVELFAKVAKAPKGRLEGAGCRALIAKLARKRIYADLIGRQVVNAEPDVRRAEEQPEGPMVALVDRTSGVEFQVRFPGDLRNYLDKAQAEAKAKAEQEAAEQAARLAEEEGSQSPEQAVGAEDGDAPSC